MDKDFGVIFALLLVQIALNLFSSLCLIWTLLVHKIQHCYYTSMRQQIWPTMVDKCSLGVANKWLVWTMQPKWNDREGLGAGCILSERSHLRLFGFRSPYAEVSCLLKSLKCLKTINWNWIICVIRRLALRTYYKIGCFDVVFF